MIYDDLAAHLVGYDPDDYDLSDVENALFDEHEVGMEQFDRLVGLLLPLIDVGTSTLTRKTYAGFTVDGRKMRRKKKLRVITMQCRRGCGRVLATTNRPIHSTRVDYERYHGICDECLTGSERADMAGPMLLRTAANIVR